HLAGDLAGEGGRIELRDAADSRAALDEALPGRLSADAERRDHPDPGDDDAAFVHVAVMDTGGGCIIPVLRAARAQWPVPRWKSQSKNLSALIDVFDDILDLADLLN